MTGPGNNSSVCGAMSGSAARRLRSSRFSHLVLKLALVCITLFASGTLAFAQQPALSPTFTGTNEYGDRRLDVSKLNY